MIKPQCLISRALLASSYGFRFLTLLGKVSIDRMREKYDSIVFLWLVYECYIVFDYLPFLFTNDLYTSARVNYENLPVSLFWGLEAMASIVSYASVGTPVIVLANIPNHAFFIFANYGLRVATSKAFIWGKKGSTVRIIFRVTCDIAVHMACAWYYS